MARTSSNRNSRPLDAAGLERLALAYVGRYATTRFKLAAYLQRKLGELGWTGDEPPEIETLVDRAVQRGYVDDRAFGELRASALTRRGYGARRIAEALRAAGLSDGDAAPIHAEMSEKAWESAIVFARRRRIGAFSAAPADALSRRRAFAAMLRAGHDPAIVRRIIAMPPGEVLEPDE